MVESESLVDTARSLELHGRRCNGCDESIDPTKNVVQCDGEVFCEDCFVCAQCFQVNQRHYVLAH